LWSLERSPYGLLLTGGSRECRQWAGENCTLKNFLSMSSTMESISKHSLIKWYLDILRRKNIDHLFLDKVTDVILFMPAGFRRHLVGKTLRNVTYSDVT